MTQIPKPLTVDELKVGMQVFNPVTKSMQKITDVVSYGNTTVFSLEGKQHGLYNGVYRNEDDYLTVVRCGRMADKIWKAFDWSDYPAEITVEELETICNILDKYA